MIPAPRSLCSKHMAGHKKWSWRDAAQGNNGTLLVGIVGRIHQQPNSVKLQIDKGEFSWGIRRRTRYFAVRKLGKSMLVYGHMATGLDTDLSILV